MRGVKEERSTKMERVNGRDGEGTTAEVVVTSGSRPGMVWLVAATVVLGVGAVVAILWGRGSPEESGSLQASTTPTSTTLAERKDAGGGPAADDRPVPSGVLATYDLTMVGAVLREDTMSEPSGGAVTVWASEDTLLSLSVRPGVQAAGPCAPSTPVDWPSELGGTVWIRVPPSEPTALLCWDRSSGDFWMLRAYWSHAMPTVAQRDDRLRFWAQAISADGPTGTGYQLQDDRMRRIASDSGGLTRARVRVWDLDGEEIVLFVIENSSAASLTNLLDTGRADRSTVQGLADVWTTDTEAGWAVPGDSELWATLSVPPELATELDHILQHLDGPVIAPVR